MKNIMGGGDFWAPNVDGEFLRGNGGNGSNVGTHQNEGLPNITGTFGHSNSITGSAGREGCVSTASKSARVSFAQSE